MGDEFYSTIKLITGEEIFALVSTDEHDGEPILILQNPVIMKIITHSAGQFIKVKPWMELSNDDIYIIRLDKVITMTEVKDKEIIFFYDRYLKEDQEVPMDSDGKVQLTDTMGYVSSVEEARKTLENLYNLKDTKES